MAKEEKPRGTTGIKIHERITWWQEDLEGKDKKKKKGTKEKKEKKKKKSKFLKMIFFRDRPLKIAF